MNELISMRRILFLFGWLLAVGCGAAENATPVDAAKEEEAVPAEIRVLRELAYPLSDPADLDPLLDRIENTRLVLLGEASHGTSEFYAWRAEISKRLIEEKGFNFIAVEGDWASLYRLNRYVKWMDDEAGSAHEIMRTFDRWPPWMWANEETAELIEWMRAFNEDRPFEERVGFYGMDVYGEDLAKRQVLERLQEVDADLAEEIEALYACFDRYDGNMHDYARAVAFGADSCAQAVMRAHQKLQEAAAELSGRKYYEFFAIQHNAKVVKNAERHFRLMATEGPQSWNARVDHFFATVDLLMDLYGDGARGVAWAHNTHIGDARATAMGNQGQRNIGQIARERMGADDVVAVGFGTHRGTVQAGRAWGGDMETMRVPPGRADSVEDLMHQLGKEQVLFIFDDRVDLSPWMTVRGHRAIGVIYHPEREHMGNYVPTILARRYDAFIFIDETRALQPVDR